jgi:hypothetical protein
MHLVFPTLPILMAVSSNSQTITKCTLLAFLYFLYSYTILLSIRFTENKHGLKGFSHSYPSSARSNFLRSSVGNGWTGKFTILSSVTDLVETKQLATILGYH